MSTVFLALGCSGRGFWLRWNWSCRRFCGCRCVSFMLAKDTRCVAQRQHQPKSECYFLHFCSAGALCERSRNLPYSLTLFLFLFCFHLTGITTTAAAPIFV